MKTILSVLLLLGSSSSFGTDEGKSILKRGLEANTCTPVESKDPVVVEGQIPFCVLKTKCSVKEGTFLLNVPCPTKSNKCPTHVETCSDLGDGLTMAEPATKDAILAEDPAQDKTNVPSKPFLTYDIVFLNLDKDPKKQENFQVLCLGRVDSSKVKANVHPYPFAACKPVTMKDGDYCPAPEDCFARRNDVRTMWPPYKSAGAPHVATDQQQVHKK